MFFLTSLTALTAAGRVSLCSGCGSWFQPPIVILSLAVSDGPGLIAVHLAIPFHWIIMYRRLLGFGCYQEASCRASHNLIRGQYLRHVIPAGYSLCS